MIDILQRETAETAKQYAFRTLLYNITYLNLKPGEKLAESQLSQMLGVSRTPIREAILELNQKKLIDIHPKSGTYVTKINSEIIEEFLGMRSLVEGEAARCASRIATDKDVENLRVNIAILQYYADLGNITKIYEYDCAFHKYIYEMCNKQYWYDVISSNACQFNRFVILLLHSKVFEMPRDDHNDIVNALVKHDEDEAYRASTRHTNRYFEYKNIVEQNYPYFF